MSVKDRLKRLTGEGGQPTDNVSQSEIISELRKKIDAIMARRASYPQKTVSHRARSARDLREVITGEEVSNALGTCFFCRNAFLSRSYHGSCEVSRFALADMEAASLLAGHPGISSMAITDALFLDTETTGLSGGTGTFAFLIGLGWFEGEDFIVCQLFSRDYHEEASMLALLAEIAREKRFLVTFNGRGFDLSLLAARYILNRLEDPLIAMPHLDLLFPSRRLLGYRLENSRLVTLESRILGFARTGDVPGYEIPKRYFDWLKSRDASLLEDVFLHNRLDVVSMVALVSHLSDLLTGGGSRQDLHHGDLLAAAKFHIGRGRYESARSILEGLTASPHRPTAREARITLSLACKRQGRWDEAVKIWEEMTAGDPEDLFAAEELAKWFEHHVHDYSKAIEIVRRLLAGRKILSPDEKEGLLHRLARLKRKASGN
ncbi:MAG TPA: ribonuclease H-like domain-containing protein [Deltaproteobacteria bacterium]|jgi:hypothetical protein|nr:ribonuclease H-like domain-containing protein [Deltaproteobacteria bacterium]